MRCGPGHTGCFISKCKTTIIQNINKTKGRGVEPKCVCVMHFFNSKKYTIYGKNTNIEEKNYSEIGQRGCGDDGTGLHYDALWRSVSWENNFQDNYLQIIPALKNCTSHTRQVQMPDFGQPGWNRAAVLQLPRIRLQRELGHGGVFRGFFGWWNSTDEDDFLGSSWHSTNHVCTFSLKEKAKLDS